MKTENRSIFLPLLFRLHALFAYFFGTRGYLASLQPGGSFTLLTNWEKTLEQVQRQMAAPEQPHLSSQIHFRRRGSAKYEFCPSTFSDHSGSGKINTAPHCVHIVEYGGDAMVAISGPPYFWR